MLETEPISNQYYIYVKYSIQDTLEKIVQKRWKTSISTVCRRTDNVHTDDNTYGLRSQWLGDTVICIIDLAACSTGRNRHATIKFDSEHASSSTVWWWCQVYKRLDIFKPRIRGRGDRFSANHVHLAKYSCQSPSAFRIKASVWHQIWATLTSKSSKEIFVENEFKQKKNISVKKNDHTVISTIHEPPVFWINLKIYVNLIDLTSFSSG